MPGGFDVAWAEGLRPACRETKFGTAILTCHNLEYDFESVCAGFLNDQLLHNTPSLPLRLAYTRGKVVPPDHADPELLSYEEMLLQMQSDPTADNRSRRRRP